MDWVCAWRTRNLASPPIIAIAVATLSTDQPQVSAFTWVKIKTYPPTGPAQKLWYVRSTAKLFWEDETDDKLDSHRRFAKQIIPIRPRPTDERQDLQAEGVRSRRNTPEDNDRLQTVSEQQRRRPRRGEPLTQQDDQPGGAEVRTPQARRRRRRGEQDPSSNAQDPPVPAPAPRGDWLTNGQAAGEEVDTPFGRLPRKVSGPATEQIINN